MQDAIREEVLRTVFGLKQHANEIPVTSDILEQKIMTSKD